MELTANIILIHEWTYNFHINAENTHAHTQQIKHMPLHTPNYRAVGDI